MKDYKEIADRVLQRRDEYLTKKQRRRTILFRNAALGFSCCLMIMVGIGIWFMKPLSNISPSIDSDKYRNTEITGSTIVTTASELTAVSTSSAETTAAPKHTVTTSASGGKSTTATTTANHQGSESSSTRPTIASSMEITSYIRPATGDVHTIVPTEAGGTPTTTVTRTEAAIITSAETSASTDETPEHTTSGTSASATRPPSTSTTRAHSTSGTRPKTTTSTYLRTTTTAAHTLTTTQALTTNWIPSSSTSDITTTAVLSTTTVAATSVSLPYDEFYYNNTRYTVTSQLSDDDLSYINEELERGDIFVQSLNASVHYTVYRHEGYDPDFACIVLFDFDGMYCLGINTDYHSDDEKNTDTYKAPPYGDVSAQSRRTASLKRYSW